MRLEYAIQADIMLNSLLDEFEKEFDRRVSAGEPYELTSYEQWIVGKVKAALPSAA